VIGLCEAFESLERKEFGVNDLRRACLIEEIRAATSVTNLA
jgi:hypothetical protein